MRRNGGVNNCIITAFPMVFMVMRIIFTISFQKAATACALPHSSTTIRRMSGAAFSKLQPWRSHKRLRNAENGSLSCLKMNCSSISKSHGVSDGSCFSSKEKENVDSMLYRIRECNFMPEDLRSILLNFEVDGKILGKVTLNLAKRLCDPLVSKHPVFEISSSNGKDVLTLAETIGNTCHERTDAVMEVMSQLRKDGMITGWRDELLPLAENFYDEPVLLVERAAAPFLGIQQYGVHISGLIAPDNNNDETKMWIARRSATKSKYPGMLDQLVAGGQPAGLGLMENVLKECMEEAGIPESLTKAGIKPVGAISYETIEYLPEATVGDENTLDNTDCIVVSRAVQFCYDLYLPSSFEPKVVDGEVESFFLWTMDEVMESLRPGYHDPFKPNCYVCIIDYLLREGYISPEVPGYLDILRELRSGYCG